MRKIWQAHPDLLSWLVLAVAMVIVVLIAARNVGFALGQWLAVIAATIALAGLCVLVFRWSNESDSD